MADQNNWWNNDPVVTNSNDNWWSNDAVVGSELRPTAEQLQAVGRDPSFAGIPIGEGGLGEKIPPKQEKPLYDELGLPQMEALGFNPLRIATDVVTGGIKGVQNIGKTVAIPLDYVLEKTVGPEFVNEVQRLREEQTLKTKPSSKAIEGISSVIVPSLVGGTGGYNLATKLAPKAPRAITYIGSAIGEALGFTAAHERGKDRLVFGKESLFGAKTPVSDETEVGQLTNDFLDALVLAYPGQYVGDLLARGAIIVNNAIVKPAINIFKADRSDEIKKTVGYSILNKLQAMRGAKTKEESDAILKSLAKDLRDNEEVLIGNTAVKRESMGALELGKTLDDVGKNRAGELRSGQLAGGRGALTAEKVSEPSNKLAKDFIPQTEQALGGMEKVKQANERIRSTATKQFEDQFERPIADTEEQIARRSGEVSDLLKNDQIDPNVNVNVGKLKDKATGEIRQTVINTRNKLKDEMDDLVKKIPDDAKVNTEDLKQFLDNPDIPAYIKKMISNSNGNFKQLYNNVIPASSREIDSLLKSGKGSIGPLSDLKDFINNAGPTKEFRNFYKTKWAPYFRNDKLGEFETLYRNTESRGLNPGTFEKESSKIISDMVEEAPFSEQLVKLLKTPEAGNKPELVTDLILGDTASKIQSFVNSGGKLNSAEIKQFTSVLEKYGATLERVAPEEKIRIDDFLTAVRDRQTDIKSLEKQLQDFTKLRDRGEKEIFDNRFKEFFRGGNRGFKSFEELIGTEGRDDLIEELVNSGDDVIVDGTKAAYLRFFKNKVFGGEATLPGGGKKASKKVLDQIFDEENSVLKYGKTIFKDSPETMQALEGLTKEVKRMEDVFNKSPQMTPFPYNSLVNQSSTALDKVIVLTFGVLNRMAARARAMKGVAVKYLDPMEEAAHLTDVLMSNPKEMAKVFEDIANLESKQMSNEMRVSIIGLVELLTLKDAINNNQVEKTVDEVIANSEGKTKEADQTTKMLKGKSNEKDKEN